MNNCEASTAYFWGQMMLEMRLVYENVMDMFTFLRFYLKFSLKKIKFAFGAEIKLLQYLKME